MADWIAQQFSSVTPVIGVLLGVALLISSIGFYRTGYFISIGYAFAVTGMAVVVLAVLHQNLTLIAGLQLVGLILWSLRLGIYLMQRESKTAYQDQLDRRRQSTRSVPLGVKFAIWISVSLLYVAMFSPSLFVLVNPTATPVGALIQIVGLITLFGGLVLEAVADKQKADFKAQFPKRFCAVGTYLWVRCPNYLGEILFWVGNWIVGAAIYTTLLQWVISAIGVTCITLIMLGSTKRLERSQAERYGESGEYQAYIRRVPVLLPFVPVYTLKNLRVFLECSALLSNAEQ